MRGSDTLELIENIVADYNTPQYNSIDEYFNNEISLLSMQIENLRRKVEFFKNRRILEWQRKRQTQ